MGLGTLPYPQNKPPTGGASGGRRSSPTSPQPGSITNSMQQSPTSPTPGSPTPRYGTPQPVPNGLSPFDQRIMDQFNSINTAQQGVVQGRWLNDLALTEGVNNLNVDFTNTNANNDLARLAQQRYRDIDLGRQGNNLGRQGNNLDRTFAGRGFFLDSAGNNQQRDMKYRANDSEAAGRGSITSGGYGQNQNDILAQFNIAQGGSQLSYDKKMSDLDQNDKALKLNDDSLSSLAKEYGVRESDVRNQLKFSIAKLGLDWDATQRQLEDAMKSGQAQLEQNALNFMAQLMAIPGGSASMADTFPNGIPSDRPKFSPNSSQPGTSGASAPGPATRPFMYGTPGAV